jgi:hypothetical protein
MKAKQSRLRVRRAPKVIPQQVDIEEHQPTHQPKAARGRDSKREHKPEGPTMPPKGTYRPVRQSGPPSSAEGGVS